MLAKRGTLQALQEPQYVFKEVPKTKRDLSGSIVLAVESRQVWIESLAEILLLCNEAANRRKVSYYVPPSARGKPLALEYLADRFDLDDPLTGFMIRTADEGWLQGFITITTFTTWQRWFRWDSLIPDAGVVDEHIDLEEDEELKVWLKKRKRDLDGNLAIELQSQIFDGDYSTNGVIWPRIAEVTLLGGLGCGSLLMNKIIYDLEASGSQYDYIVLQATENAVEFYERFGFVRVGAVARYEEISTEENEGESTEEEESESVVQNTKTRMRKMLVKAKILTKMKKIALAMKKTIQEALTVKKREMKIASLMMMMMTRHKEEAKVEESGEKRPRRKVVRN